MKEISLSKGKFAIVDDADFESLNRFRWYCSALGYAVRKGPRNGGQSPVIWMHRTIMDIPTGLVCDHINGNKLDNRRVNLRICNQNQNSKNSGLRKNNSSGYKGVAWFKRDQNWRVQITNNRKVISLGYFDDLIEAAKAYDRAAKKYHGDFASLNFPEDSCAS